MTRVIRQDGMFNVQDKFVIWWIDRTACDDYGNELPCTLTGFSSLAEALENAQTAPVYIHENCTKER